MVSNGFGYLNKKLWVGFSHSCSFSADYRSKIFSLSNKNIGKDLTQWGRNMGFCIRVMVNILLTHLIGP